MRTLFLGSVSGLVGLAVISCAGFAWAAEHGTPPPIVPDAGVFSVRVADTNQLGITLTNYGFFGNNFVSRSPSLEYPLGSGYEHMPPAGLWIGAHATDANGAFTGVTTAWNDFFQGVSASSKTEFTPLTDVISRRSSRPASAFYDPSAVSEMDY